MGPFKATLALAGLAGLMIAPFAGTIASQEAGMTAFEKDDPEALDFSDVSTPAEARLLVRQGVLVRVRLFPARSGKPDDPEDIGYLPPHVLEAKTYIEDQLKELPIKTDHQKLRIEAEYEDKSLVPSRIVYTRYGHGPGLGNMAFILEIW